MRKEIQLLNKKKSELEKHSVEAQQFSREFYKSFIRIINKYFPYYGACNNQLREGFLVRIQCAVIDIAVEGEYSYGLLLKIRKAKTFMKKHAIYEPYRLKLSNPVKFGTLVLELDKLVNPPKGFYHKILTEKKPKSWKKEKATRYAEACDEAMCKILKKYFPLLVYWRNNMTVFYSFCWIKFLSAGIEAIKSSSKS